MNTDFWSFEIQDLKVFRHICATCEDLISERAVKIVKIK